MAAAEQSNRPRWRLLWSPIGLLVVGLAGMWGIEIVDTALLDDRLQANGIRPRSRSGVDGILWSPFLHADFGHVASNSVPLLALGGLVAVRGMRYWAWVTGAAVIVGGGLTWLLAGDGVHVGASGLVFAYFGAILGAAAFERRVRALGAALLALGFYSSLIAGLVPQDFISWEGHLFGLTAGVVASKVLAEPRVRPGDRPDNPEPWELDEPWLA